jgi:hypothetical protein
MKREIKEQIDSKIESFKLDLYREFLNTEKEPEFEVRKVYKSAFGSIVLNIGNGKSEKSFKGFGFHYDGVYGVRNDWVKHYFTEADPEEFKEKLIAYAEKKYKKGDVVKYLCGENTVVLGDSKFYFDAEYGEFALIARAINKRPIFLFDPETGKWAEIVEEAESDCRDELSEGTIYFIPNKSESKKKQPNMVVERWDVEVLERMVATLRHAETIKPNQKKNEILLNKMKEALNTKEQ